MRWTLPLTHASDDQISSGEVSRKARADVATRAAVTRADRMVEAWESAVCSDSKLISIIQRACTSDRSPTGVPIFSPKLRLYPGACL